MTYTHTNDIKKMLENYHKFMTKISSCIYPWGSPAKPISMQNETTIGLIL